VSGEIPHGNITAVGPMTRGDLLMMLYWFVDTNAVPDVRGIRGLARLTRLAAILGHETGLDREIQPYFTFHPTPEGGIASHGVWDELLGLRAYQVVTPLPAEEPMPPEELGERRFLLKNHIPAHEHRKYPMPQELERDTLNNKGTFFAAKREDQMVERRIQVFKTVTDLERLPMADLTTRALSYLSVPATR
jgi:hypothetical protein